MVNIILVKKMKLSDSLLLLNRLQAPLAPAGLRGPSRLFTHQLRLSRLAQMYPKVLGRAPVYPGISPMEQGIW